MTHIHDVKYVSCALVLHQAALAKAAAEKAEEEARLAAIAKVDTLAVKTDRRSPSLPL